MSQLVRERLEKRIAKLIEQESLQDTETKLTKTRERAAAEQHRIKTLMEALNRQDELHARYLKKLFTLENEIESTSKELITVRKKLEESTSRLMQESE